MVKNIAIILPANLPVPCVYGGAIESTIQLVAEQNDIQQKLNITVFSPYEKVAKERGRGFMQTRFVWIHKGRFYHFINFFIRVLRRTLFKNMDHLDGQILKWKLRHAHFDKIIMHGNSNHLLALRKIVPKEKLVFYIHANLFTELSPKNIEIGSAAGRYVTVSEFVKREVMKNAGVSSKMITVIKNPIDLDSFAQARDLIRPAELIHKYGIQKDEIVLLFVGRIVEDKGIKHLMLALKSLPEQTKFKLLIVGSFGSAFGKGHQKDAFHEELLTLAKTMDSKIVFTGFVHNSELPKYHAIADIVAMPSLCEESAGKVAMEAMASGLPVITTNAGGIREYVTEDCSIILDRDGDFVSDLATAIDQLYGDEELRRSMGTAGEIQAQEFSPAIYYDNYVNLVQEMV